VSYCLLALPAWYVEQGLHIGWVSVCLSVYCSSRETALTQPSCRQLGCSSTGLQHGTQQQMHAVPFLQPGGVAEHRLNNNNNDNYNHDNVYGAVIMTKVIARVHPVHLMNVD